MNNGIKECHKKYVSFNKEISALEKKNTPQNKKEINRLEKELESFICNEYAKAVFDAYSLESPMIKDTYTNEIKHWDKMFGSDFNKLSISRREALVGLVEKYGAYRLK